MSFLNSLFGKWFGNSGNSAGGSVENWEQKWERERQQRMKENEVVVRGWVIDYLNKNGKLAFTWSSGGDEAFLTVEGVGYEDEYQEELSDYLIDKLEIPSAGEFTMNGQGTMYQKDNEVRVVFSSMYKELSDYNEETGEEIYSVELANQGDELLFAI